MSDEMDMAQEQAAIEPAQSGFMHSWGALLYWGAFFASGCALAVVMYLVLTSGYFTVREVLIQGNRNVSEDEVVAMLEVGAHTNMAFYSLADAQQRLMGEPWVLEAKLKKQLPGTLIVTLKETEPVAVLSDAAGAFLVDASGRRLEQLTQEGETFLPVIRSTGVVLGGGLEQALDLAKVINATGISARVGQVEISGLERGPQHLALTVQGVTVRIGSGQYKEKLTRFFEVREEIERRGIPVDYVDLRFEDRVVVKPIKAVAEVVQ